MDKEKATSFTTIKDLKNVSFQKLGSYFLFTQLPQEDRTFLTGVLADQMAVFTKMLDAFQSEYQRCVDGDTGEPVEDFDLEYLMEWRKKLHQTYDRSKMLLDHHIEHASTKAKRKLKKKYSKMKGDKAGFEQNILPGEIDTEVSLKQLEAILRDQEPAQGEDNPGYDSRDGLGDDHS